MTTEPDSPPSVGNRFLIACVLGVLIVVAFFVVAFVTFEMQANGPRPAFEDAAKELQE